VERFLHKAFADRRVNGEWFRLTEEDIFRAQNMEICCADRKRYVMPEGPFSHWEPQEDFIKPPDWWGQLRYVTI
jgi:hypothetical protein